MNTAISRFVERRLILSDAGNGLLETAYGPAAREYGSLPVKDIRERTEIPSFQRQRVATAMAALNAVSGTDLVTLGVALSAVALPPGVRSALLDELESAGTAGKRVRLEIADYECSVSGWPWEFLYLKELAGPGRPGFLVLDPRCSMIRACPRRSADDPALPTANAAGGGSALEALVVWADPDEHPWPALHAAEQVAMLANTLTADFPGIRWRFLKPKRQGGDSACRATKANLVRTLEERPAHVLLFVCHGGMDQRQRQGLVVLEREGEPGYEEVGAGELAEILGRHPDTLLILLDPCQSGNRGPDGRWQSVAQSLASPARAIVAMQFEWASAASWIFWREVFRSLTTFNSLDVAVSAAREWIYRNQAQRSLGDWGYPVLYRRAAPLAAESPAAAKAAGAAGPGPEELDHVLRYLQANPERGRFEWLEDLLVSLRDSALQFADHTSLAAHPLLRALAGRDAILSNVMAGEDDQPMVETSPAWFTCLLAPPEELSWNIRSGLPGTGPDNIRSGLPGTGPINPGGWHVRLWSYGAGEISSSEPRSASLKLPAEVSQAIARDDEVRWEVRPAGASLASRPVVRGVFRVLPTGQANIVAMRCAELEALPAGIGRESAVFQCLFSAGLYDELLRRLHALEAGGAQEALGCLVRRSLAQVYHEMHMQLTGWRAMGDPEGLWAHERAHHYAARAFSTSTA